MDIVRVLVLVSVFNGCLGDFFVNVTQTVCINIDLKRNLSAELVLVRMNSTAVFQSYFPGNGLKDTLHVISNSFKNRISNYDVNRAVGNISFCIVNTTSTDGGDYIFGHRKEWIEKLYVLDKPTQPVIVVVTNGTIGSENGKLSCMTRSTSEPPGLLITYTWFVNDTTIKNWDKYSCDDTNTCNQLIITVDRNDEFNNYTCLATETYGQTSDVSDLEKIDPKRITRITLRPMEGRYKILIYQKLTIECVVVDAHPDVKSFTWEKNNIPTFDQPGKFYTIANVTSFHSANYKCVASNGISNGTAEIYVDVLYGPTVTIMDTYSQVEGENMNITCVVQSNPPAQNDNVTWTKQGNSSFNQSGFQLEKAHVNRKDNGTFVCTVSITLQPTNGTPFINTDSGTQEINILYGPTVTLISSYSQVQGRRINIPCDVQSNPAATNKTVKWSKQGDSSFNQEGFLLSIISATKEDVGVFVCTAIILLKPTDGHYVEKTDHKDVAIDILYGPEIKSMGTYSQEEGYTIIKYCEVNSNPEATDDNITWTKQGNSSFVQKDKKLNITSVNKSDKGIFKCTVSLKLEPTDGNEKSISATENLEIDVLFGPIITPMITHSPKENDNLTVPCIVISNPPARNENVIWTKQNDSSFSQTGFQLSLVHVDKQNHGTYLCQARITLEPTGQDEVVRYDTKTVIINVLYQPIVVISERNVVYEGNMTTAFCNVTSNPLSNITWTYLPTNSNVPESNNIVYSEQYMSSELMFQPAKCYNTGVYSCQANNNIKSPTTKMMTINVQCKPRLVSSENGVENITIGRNESLNHTVEFHAFPQPTCNLQFNKSVVFGFKVNVITHDLPYESGCRIEKDEIMEADIGPYEIILNNAVGQSVVAFYIIFQREPDPPLLHAIDCIGKPQAVEIQWKPQWNGGLDQFFFIQYKSNEDLKFTNGEKYSDDGVKDVYTDIIYKLIPGKTYIFRVSSSNDKGSAESQQVNCTVVGKDDPETDNLVIIGATTGSVLGFILIIVLLMFVIFITRRTKIQRTNKKKTQLITSASAKLEEDEDEDGLKVNPMYVSSGQIETDQKKGAIYSVVQKKKKEKTVDIQIDDDASAVYTQVVKNDRKGKRNTSASKKTNRGKPANKKDQSIEMGCVYENSNELRDEAGELYANTDTDRGINDKKEYKPNKNKDGLIYADLDLAHGSNDKRFIIRGLENRNNYAVIDLSKTAEPLPSDSETDDEKESNKIKETHGTSRQQEQT